MRVWLQNRAEPAFILRVGSCHILWVFRYLCYWAELSLYAAAKGFPRAYTLRFTVSEMEIRTVQLVHAACRLYNLIVIF